jgi:soluble lytic murein transglycosylase-like protein
MMALGGFAMSLAPDDQNFSAVPQTAPDSMAAPSSSLTPDQQVQQLQQQDGFSIALRPSMDGADVFENSIAGDIAREIGTGIGHWSAYIDEASSRFGIPQNWIRAVMARESGGRTNDARNRPLRSRAGAMGLMQLMPDTYREMRRQYDLGSDPFDPHDNIIAGTAYLQWLRGRYGYPGLFAAYNHGPGNFERHLETGAALPRETRDYVAAITGTTLASDTSHVRTIKRRLRSHKRTVPASSSLRLVSL